MKFSELEELMSKRGVITLADIARTLKTTPQAVSNWKSRNQVPYRIAAILNKVDNSFESSPQGSINYRSNIPDVNTYSVSDIFLTMAEQLKVIMLITFMAVFFTFTYEQFIKEPMYVSQAKVLIPDNKASNLGGLAGLASQFGVNVNVPTGGQTDLSSPTIFPELIHSRTFAEEIMDEKFYSEKFGKELTLLAILTHGDKPPNKDKETLITNAVSAFTGMVAFNKSVTSAFSVITVQAREPVFAKELADVVIKELEKLSRYFKSKTVNEKIKFIENRITSVGGDLEESENRLKIFNEQNRQISSPALELESERLESNVEVQKSIFLTLKQQLELAKIEEIQEASILQVLDAPQLPLEVSNKNLKRSILFSVFFGVILGALLGFSRSYINNSDLDERKKFRRIKNFFNKKSKDLLLDRRICGVVSLLMLLGLPYYLGHQSSNPVFFGMYSAKFMLVNTVYVSIFIISSGLFIYLTKKNL